MVWFAVLMQKRHTIWNNNFYILQLIWQTDPFRVIFSMILNMTDSVWDVYMSVFFYRLLINGIVSDKSFPYLCTITAIGAFLFILRRLLFSIYKLRISVVADQELYRLLMMRMYKKAVEADLAAFEHTAFYQSCTKACLETGTRPAAVLDNVTAVCSTFFSISVMTAVLIRIDPVALVFVLFPLCSQLLFGKKRNILQYALDSDTILPLRIKDYVTRTVYAKDCAKELRTTGIFSVLLKNYQNACGHIIARIAYYGKKLTVQDTFISLFNLYIPFFTSCLYAVYKITESETMSIGEYSVISVAVISLAGCLKRLAEIYGTLHKNSLYIENLRAFFEYMPSIAESQDGLCPAEFEILELKNVSFRYEGAEADTLHNVSLTVKAGQRIMLAGLNGAGKTTIIKLIMRLYDPQSGEITYNGKNIKQYNVRLYRQIIGTVFQDFKVFAVPVIDNVLAGRREPEAAAERALEKVDLLKKIREHPLGLYGLCGKEFNADGIDFSGGEMQKLALARIFAGNPAILILDEPSAALDPAAEYALFQDIAQLAYDKTVIFISHRLSSAKTADMIYIIDGAAVKEAGTHQELMALKGLYYEMFTAQATSYCGDRK